MLRLLLASQSPARLATLRSAGIEPVVQVSGVDEDAVLEEARRRGPVPPRDAPLLLARAKAEHVAGRTFTDMIVLGCDSILELDGEVHGKPADPDDAVRRWRRMRGRSGVLYTGHWLIDLREPDDGGTGRALGETAGTTVHFADLSDAEIDAYVDTGEPLRVAGAFTIDGLGGPFVTGIEGDHHAVVGLSLPLLRTLLAQLGVGITDLWRTDRDHEPVRRRARRAGLH
ncbi:Maf family protein [Jiangella gansuensis]|uniref:Maf family protein n=1 Tax=Jiangella gansuensis TaxID=281473 RepID=UPI0004B80A6D|nr:nucleoside triphosphate pyrophosphatase [Jiangella gansuensis]